MGRAPCCDKTKVKRGPWSPDEDLALVTYIANHGHTNWRALPQEAGLARCGKSCRLRWVNYLKPGLKRGPFTLEEEEKVMKLHETLGNKWSKIASYFPGRTDNEIKNFWNSYIKKKLAKTGGDPLHNRKKGDNHNQYEANKNMSGDSPFSQAWSTMSSMSGEGNSPNGVIVNDNFVIDNDNFDPILLEEATGNFTPFLQAEINISLDMEWWSNAQFDKQMHDDLSLDMEWLNNLDLEDPFLLPSPAMDQAVSAESSMPLIQEVGGDGNKETMECDQEWVNYLENELPEDHLTNEVFDDGYFAPLFSPSPK